MFGRSGQRAFRYIARGVHASPPAPARSSPTRVAVRAFLARDVGWRMMVFGEEAAIAATTRPALPRGPEQSTAYRVALLARAFTANASPHRRDGVRLSSRSARPLPPGASSPSGSAFDAPAIRSRGASRGRTGSRCCASLPSAPGAAGVSSARPPIDGRREDHEAAADCGPCRRNGAASAFRLRFSFLRGWASIAEPRRPWQIR